MVKIIPKIIAVYLKSVSSCNWETNNEVSQLPHLCIFHYKAKLCNDSDELFSNMAGRDLSSQHLRPIYFCFSARALADPWFCACERQKSPSKEMQIIIIESFFASLLFIVARHRRAALLTWAIWAFSTLSMSFRKRRSSCGWAPGRAGSIMEWLASFIIYYYFTSSNLHVLNIIIFSANRIRHSLIIDIPIKQ